MRISLFIMFFAKSNVGIMIQDNLAFSSAGNQGVLILKSTFYLSSGAIAYRATGATSISSQKTLSPALTAQELEYNLMARRPPITVLKCQPL
jgi:hypothetical protein